jgi:hypothetical protein
LPFDLIAGLEKSKKSGLFRKLKEKADTAAKAGADLGKKAIEKTPELGKQLKDQSLKSLDESITAVRKASTSGAKNVELLKQLAELKDQGIISDEEFEAKKKDILSRI